MVEIFGFKYTINTDMEYRHISFRYLKKEIFDHSKKILQIGYTYYTYSLFNNYCVLVESKNFEDIIRYSQAKSGFQQTL